MSSALDPELQEIAAYAAEVLEAPIALVTQLGEARPTFLANVGFDRSDAPLAEPFCADAVQAKGVFEIPDATADPRFAENPLVTGKPRIRFYAGMAAASPDGVRRGTLCVLDVQPRRLTDLQRRTLAFLARQVERRLAHHEDLRKEERASTAATLALKDQKLLRLVTDRMPVRVAYIDPEFRFCFMNDAYERITGLDREQALGRTVAEALGQPVFETVRGYLERALRGETHTQEFDVPYPEGLRRIVVTYVPDPTPDGEIRGVVVQSLDVTEQRAAERALAETRTHLDQTLQTAGVATFDWDVPNDRVFGNALLGHLYGFAAHPEGNPIADFYAGMHPDDRSARRAALERTLATGGPYEVPYRVTGADGQERWVLARGEVALSDDGKPLRLTGVVLDVTEANRARQGEREALTLLRGIADGTRELIVSIDCDFRFTSLNEAYRADFRRVFGVEPEVGQSVLDLLAHLPQDRENAKALFERALAGENVEFTAEFGAEDRRSAFDMRFYPVRNDAGEIVGAAEIARDVTERVRAAEERERLLTELAEERARIALILEKAEVATFEWDSRADVIRANPLLNEFFGVDVPNGPIAPYLAAIHPDDREATGAAIDRSLRTGEAYEMEYRVTDATGSLRWLLARGKAETETGRISGVVLDVTKAHETDAAFREREELFRTVFEQAPDDAIVVMDLDRTITAWSPAAERICGWSADEAIGQSADIIFTPEDREQGTPVEEMEGAARDGKATDERWHMRKDGSRFWGSGTMNALHDAEGNVRGYLKVFRDATARYRQTETLAFLRHLTDAVLGQRDPVAIVRASERMLGEHLGVTRVLFAESLPDGERVEVREEWAPLGPSVLGMHRFTDFGAKVEADFREGRTHVSRDSERDYAPGAGLEAVRAIRAGSGISVPIHKEGQLAALFVVHDVEPRDWTPDEVDLVRQVADRTFAEVERARAERALRQANEELERRVEERTEELERAVKEAEGFNYSISHDLRTPLRAMVATATILQEELGPDLSEDHRELLERQSHNAKRMGRLIDELLRLSRLARAPVMRERLDMTAKFRSVFEEIEEHGRSNGCRLEVQEGMTAEGDRNLVRTVIHNLLGNACKFSPQGGTVGVSEENGVFCVRDEGVGFEMAYAPKIFLPFERLVSDAEFEGTGIGLANVKRIVERHGGMVWAESVPGEGASFYFTLG